MSNIVNWIKSMRLPIVLMAGLLSIVSFQIVHSTHFTYLVAFFIVAVGSATMVHNDWIDREHDLKKGKNFAYAHSDSFLKFDIFLWIISLNLLALIFVIDIRYGVLSAAIIAMGLIYSGTRRIPLLAGIIVALTSSCPALYGVVAHPSRSGWLLFASVAMIIYSREIIKDIDDLQNDKGYKWTIPLGIGAKKAKIIAGLSILFVPFVLIGISPITMIGTPLLLISAIILMFGQSHQFAKCIIDFVMLMLLIVLLVIYH